MRTRCPTCGRMQQRSTPQNRKYWALLTEISEKLKVDGNNYAPQIWAEWFKLKYLGAEEYKLPSGKSIVVPNSTADLDQDSFSDYLTKIEAWSAERGVFLESRDFLEEG